MKRIIISILLLFILVVIIGCKKNPPTIFEPCKHENKIWIILENATCIKNGSKEQRCSECNETITTAIIQKTAHEEIIDQEILPTCEEDGLTEGSHCKHCNEIIITQNVVPKTGHHYLLDETLSNAEKNVYVCSCGDSYEEINNNGSCTTHKASDWIIVEDSTCEKLGIKQKICLNCNLMLEQVSIELKAHTETILNRVEPECEKEGLTEGIICSECKKIIKAQTKIPALEHNYEVTEVVNPTSSKKGYIKYTCSLCGDSYQKELDELGNYNEAYPTEIILADNNSVVSNNNGGVLILGNQIEITLPGIYDFSGKLSDGNIIVTLADSERATLNLKGVNITSKITHPIYIVSGDEVDISANSGTENYIYDLRPTATSTDTGAAIYADVDLDIKGKGNLYIESTYNNGIGTTKDLKIKNLNLTVNVPNNAIKGNDSITIESGTIEAISSSGDALKTENSDVSTNGNQRGIIHIIDGTIDLYAACDGIDASYQVLIDGGIINIYTEKYSEYSGEVSTTTSSINYLRISSRTNLNSYTYSAMFITESGTTTWVNGTLESNNRSKYYKFNVPADAKYVKYYAYSSSQSQGQNTNYSYVTDQLTLPSSYDTYYVTQTSSNLMIGDWTNYSTGGMGGPGGMPGGGMQEGNPESSLYSCKGIKADNDIIINGGTISISSHDDGIHTNSDVLLENGSYGAATLTINGGTINITTDDDGLHADSTLTINGGNIIINKSYEGIEGTTIYFKGGTTQIKSSDDGINAKTTLYFQGGVVYLDANGDGIDSNGSVYMSGGIVFALGPTNGGNGVIDIGDRGYAFSFTGGLLLAIGCSGMDVAPTGASGNTVTASRTTSTQNSYLTITSNGKIIAVMKVTKANQTYRVFAYNNSSYPSATISSSTSTNVTLTNGLYYANPN